MGRVARLLEAVRLGRDDRVDEAELVDEEDPRRRVVSRGRARRRRAPGARVVEDAHAAGDVERSVLERQRGRVADEQLAVPGRELLPRREELRGEVDADDALDERRQRERERPGATAAVERTLGAVERREQLLHPSPSAAARSFLVATRYPTTSLIDEHTLRSGGPRDDPAGDLIGDRA